VSYASEVKFELLKVPVGPVVSASAAEAMASGVRDLLKADVGLSVTGVAGPEEQDGQPAGTVFVGLLARGERSTRRAATAGGPSSRARLQRHQRARRAASGPRRFELSPGSRLVSK